MLFLQRYSCDQNVANIKLTHCCVHGFKVMHSLFQQERHDVSSNGNPRLPHIPAVSQHLYSPQPSLSHSASSDFQPPYFPPPYQHLPYTQPSDPYAHLGDPFSVNSIHHSVASNQQQSWPGRQGQEAIGSTAAADSAAPFWAWKGARPGCGGTVLGDRSCCLHIFMESIP